jgi:hypothetical protein
MGPSSGRRRRAIPYAPACTDVADPVLSNFTSLPGQWMYRTAVNSSALVVSKSQLWSPSKEDVNVSDGSVVQ